MDAHLLQEICIQRLLTSTSEAAKNLGLLHILAHIYSLNLNSCSPIRGNRAIGAEVEAQPSSEQCPMDWSILPRALCWWVNHVAHLSLNSTHHVTAEVSSPRQQPFILTLAPDTALLPLKTPSYASSVRSHPGRTPARGSPVLAAERVKFMEILWPRQILPSLNVIREMDLLLARICSQQLFLLSSHFQLPLVQLASSNGSGGRTWCP